MMKQIAELEEKVAVLTVKQHFVVVSPANDLRESISTPRAKVRWTAIPERQGSRK